MMQSEVSNVQSSNEQSLMDIIHKLEGKVEHLINSQKLLKAYTLNLEEKISECETECRIHKDILYQLLGGLFHHEKQGETLDEMVTILLDDQRGPSHDKSDDDNYYGVYPTTRQGDENEIRLNDLKERFDDMEGKLEQIGALFPPNKISQERIKRSVDLCGNE